MSEKQPEFACMSLFRSRWSPVSPLNDQSRPLQNKRTSAAARQVMDPCPTSQSKGGA